MIALLVLLIALVHPSLGSFWDVEADNCYYALRHRGTPSVEMFRKMQQWGTTDIWQGLALDEHDCFGNFAGCQTFSCVDANGDQIFVVNACAPNGGKCTRSDLDPICAKDGGIPKCEICQEGLCNKADIELKKPVLKITEKRGDPETGTDNAKNKSSSKETGTDGAKNKSSSTPAN
uniref:SCP domain-containing protein n=1 Tax=Globodera pallida TaxID=36090 RepID=A0A183BY60_GLOPA